MAILNQNTKKRFEKSYPPIWSDKVFVIKKLKNTVPWTYVVSDLNGEEIAATFYEKVLQMTSKKEFRIEKAIKINVDRLYVKWKGYDNSCWINMKDIL